MNSNQIGFKLEEHRELTQVQTFQDSALGIMKWGRQNTFPQTLKNLIEQSANARPAVNRTAKFYKGRGFASEDIIVSPFGLTLKKVVSILADDYAMFEAFAIHCNYNIRGVVSGITPLRITDLRFNEFDELNFASKIGYHENFGMNSEVRRTVQKAVTVSSIKWINRFNPDVVSKQIKKTEGGIGNFQGQLLYHTETGHSSYPIPPLQAAINYVLSDVENGILMRKETSTGFISSYLLKTMLDSEDPNLIALEDAFEEAQGARGNGKIITMSGLSEEEMSGTVLEEIAGGSGARSAIVSSISDAYTLDQKVINGAYLIPPILAGVDVTTGFSQESLKDAYFVFNAQTQGGRDIIESELNRVIRHSVFKDRVEPISIKKLTLDIAEVNGDETNKKNN